MVYFGFSRPGFGLVWVGQSVWVSVKADFSTDSDDVKEIGKSDLVDSSSPDLNMANREKKKRKKRRQQRKPTGKPSFSRPPMIHMSHMIPLMYKNLGLNGLNQIELV